MVKNLPQKIGSLEEKVDIAINQSQKAKEFSELARDISLRQLHSDLQIKFRTRLFKARMFIFESTTSS